MRVSEGRLLLSPSDVVEATTCRHRLVTALRAAHGVEAAPPSTGMASVAAAGQEHEAGVVAALDAVGLRRRDLSGVTPDLSAWRMLAGATLAALGRDDVDVVQQGGVLLELGGGTVLVGRPDLLVRTPDGWRVEDAKLARSVKPTALLQTMLYRDALRASGVRVHPDVRLHLGTHEAEDVPARSADAWARRQLADVGAAVAGLAAGGALEPGHVEHVAWCGACDDDSPCGRQRRADRHLGLVADLRRDQAARLAAAGITTIDALAALPAGPDAGAPGPAGPPGRPAPPAAVPGMSAGTLEVLREQAALQVQAERTGTVPVRVRRHPGTVVASAPRPGLWLVPEPDAGDVFFDIEGYPLFDDGGTGADSFGLEYLLGAAHAPEDGSSFTSWWGDDRAAERTAFEGFVAWVERRRREHPGLHVHHYAPYEPSALARLAQRHGTCADVVDAWLAEGVLVDLYSAVRRGLRAGVASYSIKKVEALYGVAHTGDVTSAGDSIEQYEAYRASDDPARSAALRAAITEYNRQDCDSTRQLRDYLLRLRGTALAEGVLQPLEVVGEEVAPEAPPTPLQQLREELAAAGERLLDGADVGTPSEDPVLEGRRVLAGLLGYAVREEKAAWQDVFRVAEDVAAHGAAKAVDDASVLGGLELQHGEASPKGDRVVWTFLAPVQDHKVETGGVQAAVGGRPVPASVSELEAVDAGLRVVVSMKADDAAAGRWSARAAPPVDALVPARFVSAEPLQRSLLDLVGTLAGPDAEDPAAPRAAARALLLGRAHLATGSLPPPRDGEDPVAHAVRLAQESRGGGGLVVAVQGPPGAGKSYLGSEVVDALLAGARARGTSVVVGVTANSHTVVKHLLGTVHERTPSAVVRHKQGGHSSAKDPARWTVLCEHPAGGGCAEPVLATSRTDGWAAGQVLGGTAWAFAREDAPELDWLVVDEAGQMSLGDVLAAARTARNVLLLGDPQQLAKPARAVHPTGVGVSALEHLMRGAPTMPEGTGIFQDATRRMHERVSGFISDIAYDGRLVSHPTCADRAVLPLGGGGGAAGDDALLSGTGLRWVPVEHTGNTQGSDQECAVVVNLVRRLLQRRWTLDGVEHRDITPADVLVVSPYNVQVRRLAAALAEAGLPDVGVGTVDRFQGQQAVAVVYSTASSDVEGAPRGIGFLYDVHRLNVAVSRARCLAFWVGSPDLLGPRVTSRQQVPLVDAHCRFVEGAALLSAADLG